MEEKEISGLIKSERDEEINSAGDKFYHFEEGEKLLNLVTDFNFGDIFLGDIYIRREYLSSEEGDHIRLLHTEICHKENKPRATIAMFHGMGQGSDTLIETSLQYAKNGYKIETIDFRGYGGSGGIRGEYTITDLQKDIMLLLKEVDTDIPLFVYAHSMGCMVLLSFLMNNPGLNISGVILVAPLTSPPKNVKLDYFRRFVAKMIGQNLPEMIFNPRGNASAATSKAYLLKWYLTNRKAVPIIGAKQMAGLAEYMYHFEYNSSYMRYPILVHLGGADEIVNNEGTKKIFEAFGTEDKQIYEYEGYLHELHYEDCNKEMFRNTISWINRKFKDGGATKVGAIDFDDVKIAFLKKKAPFKHWKQLIAASVIVYYLIGYLLMVSKVVNKRRHEMLAFWPYQLYRLLFGKR
ncbi:unnamed protein product [Moneuplotes crassus]|uniref:Serine aminopeptidase S33 domain-containing protein n=1 Tax=Euplotes crassus TaxID=5936 RepID=A0AAD1UGV3_EUPCR|nr:unnamed protein product [Moneuplotes crassus]